MPDQHLLDALLDSWDRNNTILVNLLRAIPPERLATSAMEGSPSPAPKQMPISPVIPADDGSRWFGQLLIANC